MYKVIILKTVILEKKSRNKLYVDIIVPYSM